MTALSVTVHFQSTGTVPGDGRPVAMFGASLTIGRGAENDMVLPDPQKAISKRHCAIETAHGAVVAIDMSTNGTFLNYSKMPIGDVPAPLNDGDVLTIGSYELLVEIREAAAAPTISPAQVGPDARSDDLLGDDVAGGDFLDDLLGDGAPVTGPSSITRRDDFDDDGLLPPLDDDDLLGDAPPPGPAAGASQPDHAPSAEDHFRPSPVTQSIIPEDWNPDDLLGDEPLSPPAGATGPDAVQGAADSPAADPFADDPFATAPPAPATPSEHDAPQATPPQQAAANAPDPDQTAAARAATSPGAGQEAAARAFLKTAGAEGLALSDDDLVPTLSRMGHVMRILIKGLREVLMTRTSIKSEFRIQQTVIGSGGNNPLKFSISPEQAVEAMIKPSTTGYLDPIEAAEQALQDIKAHEIAMMTGMEAALKDVLRQLSPEELEKQMHSGGGLGGLLKGRKARYWEVYEKMYAEISDRAENEFHEMFSREFARAYQAQLERLK
jgi:type VI secretion system FHA domain protein